MTCLTPLSGRLVCIMMMFQPLSEKHVSALGVWAPPSRRDASLSDNVQVTLRCPSIHSPVIPSHYAFSSSFACAMSWSLLSSPSTSGKAYARPLGLNETGFYIDRKFNGTSDIIWRYLVEETDRATCTEATFFSEKNVKRAWATLKQWYPIVGARTDESDGLDAVRFVVSEHALSHHLPDEVTFTPVSSREEVDKAFAYLMRENPMVDHHLVARVLVFPFTSSKGTYEVFFRFAHCMADGISSATVARTFFDVLVSPPAPIPKLEERLTMALSSDELNPTKRMSLPRQRWRRAIAQVTFLNRRRKLAVSFWHLGVQSSPLIFRFKGGHALPRKITESTYRTPGLTDRVAFRFSQSETAAILDGCKRQKLTFGAALPVVCQLAITRILHRRYLRGEISEEEWEHRRRQPIHFGGPINLRPYVDADWQRKGGLTEIGLMIDIYECTLPFMPTPFGTRRDESVPRVNGAPPYSALMSHARFFHRARFLKDQLQKRATHPLILDIAQARQPSYILGKKKAMTHWLAEKKGEPLPSFVQPPHWDSVPSDHAISNFLSSVGQVSSIG